MKSLAFILIFAASAGKVVAQQVADGPLTIHKTNSRYFSDNGGRVIYLTGSHTWENLQDMRVEGEALFDYDEYLAMMSDNGHNFMRMWMFEQARMASWTADSIVIDPLPFARTGPGLANDGKPKFDLTKYNDDYFNRLRSRIQQAGEKGIYVSVMLFQGWCLDRTNFGIGDPFPFLPYHSANNINGISAPHTTEDYDDKPSLHSMKIPTSLLNIQKAYVRKVIETVNDLDNVLYEIINEGGSTEWQYHMIRFIKETENEMAKQHPVGMTHRGDRVQQNADLMNSPADWISPNATPVSWTQGDSLVESSYKFEPPASTGKKVIVTDTDHLWGHGGNHKWVWKSFLRGLNPIFMDPWSPLPGRKDDQRTAGWLYDQGGISKDDRNYPDYTLIRKSMGCTMKFANRLDLVKLTPHGELTSTKYCLTDQQNEFLVYFQESVEATVDLRNTNGSFRVEWFIPLLNQTVVSPRTISGGKVHTMKPPTILDALLYLKKTD